MCCQWTAKPWGLLPAGERAGWCSVSRVAYLVAQVGEAPTACCPRGANPSGAFLAGGLGRVRGQQMERSCIPGSHCCVLLVVLPG